MFCARPLAGPPVATQGSSVVAVLQTSTARCFDTQPSGNCKEKIWVTPKSASRKSQVTDFAR
ncbi:hypothetical protein LBMAG40_02550 [Cyanobium sp.]|nr:hypothetical protein LBMAG40_02550 [Cyanobium sp.]